MDEHTAQIEHLISHYLHRDLFRIYVRDYIQRTGRQTRVRTLFDTYHLPISHYKCNGDRVEDWQIAESTVDNTRRALKRAKLVTVQHIHNLLHAEPMLSIHDHIHNDGVIFTYVIHEVDF